ncbi:hypothetical protein [Streptomyces sp. NPDC047000]|uniref:hypothetical protein n=1 Tax=Streptomyces sp. NPDC047000 TaxID=3155474 RepID=UPI0033DE9925
MSLRTTKTALIEQGHWLTVRGCKRVLVVVHTVTFAQRLREVFGLLHADLRVQVVFTAAPHAFGSGVAQFLHGLGITTVPWEEALRAEFDLVLAAGSRGLHELRAPVLRISHGAGQIKPLTDVTAAAPGQQRWPGMLSPQHLMHDGRVVPAAIGYAHDRDLAELARSCPQALPVAHVVGDPCVDRIVAELPRRDAYRRVLGVGTGQRLVVVTSTWGPASTFGRLDSLVPHLLTQLPGDRYRIALLLHPNVYAGHGTWQVRGWLAACERLAIVPPEADWQALLIAADWLVGDHGSLTAYGTLTDATVLLTGSPEREMAPFSPAALLATAAPVMSPLHPPAGQLEYAARTRRPGQYARVAAALSSVPGEFHRRMRSIVYRLLDLSEPAHPPYVPPPAAPSPLSEWEVRPDRKEAG